MNLGRKAAAGPAGISVCSNQAVATYFVVAATTTVVSRSSFSDASAAPSSADLERIGMGGRGSLRGCLLGGRRAYEEGPQREKYESIAQKDEEVHDDARSHQLPRQR